MKRIIWEWKGVSLLIRNRCTGTVQTCPLKPLNGKTQISINAEQFLSLIFCILHYFGSYSLSIAKQTCLSTAPDITGIIVLMSAFRTAGPGLLPTEFINCSLGLLNFFFFL